MILKMFIFKNNYNADKLYLCGTSLLVDVQEGQTNKTIIFKIIKFTFKKNDLKYFKKPTV